MVGKLSTSSLRRINWVKIRKEPDDYLLSQSNDHIIGARAFHCLFGMGKSGSTAMVVRQNRNLVRLVMLISTL